MKEPKPVTPVDLLQGHLRLDAIIDARSPAEYALDHLPGAICLPVLSDDERARVGLLNREASAFEAHRLGAGLVSANIARHLQGPLADKPRDFRALVYCWRGGNRSGALATVMARVGWQVMLLEGGYKAWRKAMLDTLSHRIGALSLIVLAGRTGTGKSRVLTRMGELGAQVLDLEALARHRGSVLGAIPGDAQPSQKHFETLLWSAIAGFETQRPVWVESESRKIGAVQVPHDLIVAMRASPCLTIDMPADMRCELLLDDYPHLVDDPRHLLLQLERLQALHGQERLEHWRDQIAQGQFRPFVLDLLQSHYDPAYDRSMKRNYLDQASGRAISPDAGVDSLDEMIEDLARQALALEAGLARAQR
ncbi:MAG: tRNA 2-selenouridine(34) synthase MnmH [Burkholderiaceae bacterium]